MTFTEQRALLLKYVEWLDRHDEPLSPGDYGVDVFLASGVSLPSQASPDDETSSGLSDEEAIRGLVVLLLYGPLKLVAPVLRHARQAIEDRAAFIAACDNADWLNLIMKADQAARRHAKGMP